VFETYCASCHHQAGPTPGHAPERFGSILNLDELARDPNLVAPGRPDASLIYQRMLGRHSPEDVYGPANGGKGPTPEEIEAVRDWIEGLALETAGETRAKRGPLAAVSAEGADRIDLALWPDSPDYKVGDLVSVSVSTSLACHLTLISIDRDGKAIVLYPNDFEPDNLIAPGVAVRVPGAGSAYRLRLDRAGPETVVGICQRRARRPEGIGFDFEKQRFAILGDWRAFLRTMGEHEAEIMQGEAARSRRKSRSVPPPVDPAGPAIEGRAALTITVEEAPKR
jgi:hypothetical protein